MATAASINQQLQTAFPCDTLVEPALASCSASRRASVSNASTASPSPAANASRTAGAPSAACDACYNRKSRCALHGSVQECYSCDFRRQECTFRLGSHLGKRKLEASGQENESIKRRAPNESTSSPMAAASEAQSARATQTERSPLTTQYIGTTTELEPFLLDYLPLDHNGEGQLAASHIRKVCSDGTYVRMMDNAQPGPDTLAITVETIENLVTPFGPSLIEKFFQNLHPTFPILLEDNFRSIYQKKLIPPVLLSAVYLVSLKWLDSGSGIQTLRKPDAARLELTALKLLNDSITRPQICTIQAGLLLSQKSTLFSSRLMSQLVTAAFDMGLHQDCSPWNIPNWEKGLRKRLAWALYIQDKWCALAHGRPSHIFAQNWTVQELSLDDFDDCYANGPISNDPPAHASGSLLFSHLITLTTILSDILDTFYTLRAAQDFASAGDHATRIILERAKPIQIRLKEWFSRLPRELKMDSSLSPIDDHNTDTTANGGLHLAYFATEITLHRCIVRSIRAAHTDDYLTHICRSAAKTRLISAMDFVNRLRPNHLRAFWPAASRTNFALIVGFGMLLRVTAQTREEEEFYSLRLGEYRWTLEVSKRHAAFLGWVVECLDVMSGVVRDVRLEKPVLEDYMAQVSPPDDRAPPPPPPRRHGQGGRWADAKDGEDDGGSISANSSTTRKQYMKSIGPSLSVSALASPATSVSGGSRRGSAVVSAEERNVMNVADRA